MSFFPCLSPHAASGPRKEERTHHSVEVVPGEDEIVLHTLANGLLEEPEVLAHGVGRALEPGLLLSLKRERKRKEEVRGEKEEEEKKTRSKKTEVKLHTLDSTDCDAASTSTNPRDLYPPTLTLYACARCRFSEAELNCVSV